MMVHPFPTALFFLHLQILPLRNRRTVRRNPRITSPVLPTLSSSFDRRSSRASMSLLRSRQIIAPCPKLSVSLGPTSPRRSVKFGMPRPRQPLKNINVASLLTLSDQVIPVGKEAGQRNGKYGRWAQRM